MNTMKTQTAKLTILLAALAALSGAGCKEKGQVAAPAGGPVESAPVVTNRIDVPDAVRRNLGITFAKVERRQVASTIRVPGQFEMLPSARRGRTA
jgi:hypothetical protein